ncbi:MAG: hypothetical protein IT340_22530 [Chloroflexi bacterium]|nr:hypothetical protein [Chloroflexota bacterium]
MLEVLKELDVEGDMVALGAFIAAVAHPSAVGWARYLEGERRNGERLPLSDERRLWFRRDSMGDIPPTDLFLVCGPGHCRVTNIVPQELGSLTRSQYNAVLDDFAARVAGPAAAVLGLSLRISPDRQPLTFWLSPEAARRLTTFSQAANMSTGSGHPLDFRRWAAFLIQVHRERSRLDAPTLRRWLVEIEGWPEDTASGLVGEFEFARDLLSAYDDEP